MPWVFVLLLVLAGCQTAREEAVAAVKARQAAFHQKCVLYGFKPGTEAYGRCRQRFDLGFAREEAARRAMILQYWTARPQPPIYTPTLRPTVNTHCYRVGNAVNCTSR